MPARAPEPGSATTSWGIVRRKRDLRAFAGFQRVGLAEDDLPDLSLDRALDRGVAVVGEEAVTVSFASFSVCVSTWLLTNGWSK